MALVWDSASGRFRDASTGRFVRADAFEASLNALIDGSRERMAGLAQQLRGGRLSLAAWQEAAAAELKAVSIVTGTLARGGVNHMTPSAYGQIGRMLRTQYEYLQAVADDIAAGRRLLDGRLDNSARLFAGSARGIYAAGQEQVARQRGLAFERRQLSAAESCEPCQAEARKGWQPIGSLAAIGSLRCRSNCRCRLIFARRERAATSDAA